MARVKVHTWQSEVKLWAAPISFENWELAVCQGRAADADALKEYYGAQWDAADCREFMMLNKMFKRVPKPRQVVLDVEAVNRRFALCLWRECGKLLTRRMTPEARQIVCGMSERMEQAAGITVYRGAVE